MDLSVKLAKELGTSPENIRKVGPCYYALIRNHKGAVMRMYRIGFVKEA